MGHNGCSLVRSGDDFFSSLQSIFDMAEMCDVVIELNDEHRFKAHRVILAASSPFFRAMFTNDLAEAHSDVVRLSGDIVDPQSFKTILDFIYSRQLRLTDANVHQVLRDGCFLLMPDVEARCCSFYARKITAANCFELLELAGDLACNRLENCVLKFICRQGFSLLAKTPDFLNLDASQLRRVLQCCLSGSVTEEALLDILLEWVSVDEANRSCHFASLVKLIKLQLIWPDVLATKLKSESLLANDEGCRKIAESILRKSSGEPNSPTSNNNSYFNCLAMTTSARRGRICCNTAMDAILVFDPVDRQWTSVKNLIPPSMEMAAATLFDFDQGRLGIVGSDIRGPILSTRGNDCGLGSPVAVFNWNAQKWQALPSLNNVRCRPAVVYLPYVDTVFVAGGITDSQDAVFCKQLSSCEVWHASKSAWKSFTSLPEQGGEGVRLVSLQDRIFAFGGVCSIPDSGGFHRASKKVNYVTVQQIFSENFEVRSNSDWSELASMLTNRTHFGAAVVGDRIYAVGGHSNDGAEASAEYYDPDRNQWFPINPLPHATPVVTAVAFGGLVTCLLCKLQDERPGIAVYDIVSYDPRDNKWHTTDVIPPPCKIGISYPSMTILSSTY